MFDPTSVEAFGITLIAMVFGITEFLKDLLGWDGKKVTVLALVMGVLVYLPTQLIQFFPQIETYLSVGYLSLVFGLTAAGFYKFADKRLEKNS